MKTRNKVLAVVLVAVVCLLALVCFAACGESYGVEIKSDATKKIEVLLTRDSYWYFYDVDWVRWAADGKVVTNDTLH